jgi:uncharacterized membrane protein
MAEATIDRTERWIVRSTHHAPWRTQRLERLATGLAGVSLLVLSRRSRWKVPAAFVAGAAIARAASGLSPLADDEWGRMNSTQAALSGGRGEDIEEQITIGRPVQEVYAFWRTLSSLTVACRGRVAAEPLDADRSHWKVRARAGDGPALVEWTAEIVNDVPDTLLGWRTLGDADVASAGSVRFSPAPGDEGTEVRVHLRCAPPLGKLGAAAAAIGGQHPAVVVREALRDIKRYLELGRGVALSR